MKPQQPADPDPTSATAGEGRTIRESSALTSQAKGEGARETRRLWLGLALLMTLWVGVCLWLTATPREPCYGGKGILRWFAEGEANGWAQNSKAFRAFEAMEGDAVPFLAQVLAKTGPSRAERWYEQAFNRIPTILRKSLPKPRTSGTYRMRRIQAIMMLNAIGAAQLRKWREEGKPSTKPSITNAIPAIRAAFKDPDARVRMVAPQAITGLGPLGAPLVPDLIPMLADGDFPASMHIIAVLGSMGDRASNAVPALIQVITNAQRMEPASAMFTNAQPMQRSLAVFSLGFIGAPARAAVPVLIEALKGPDVTLRSTTLQALARIGDTPGEVVPTLTALARDSDTGIRAHARLALWNRDRQNTNLYEEIIATIRSSLNLELAATFRVLGTNAAPFAVELERAMASKFDDQEVKWIMRSIRNPIERPGDSR